MMKTLRTCFLMTTALALVSLPALGQETPWLRIHVEEDDETKVEVNLPLAAVEALGDSFAEQLFDEIEQEWVENAEVDADLEDGRALWRSLRDNPGAWVTIDEEEGGQLRARMDAGEVRIEGGDDDGKLEVRIPVTFGDALFGDEGREPDLGAAIRALADHEDVLVSVDGGDGKVRIWIEPR